MELKEYFEKVKGMGVLATSDSEGKVDVAIYAKPHFMDDGTIALIMADKLSHHNLESNGHAAYLFKEEGPGYKGVRLFLTKRGKGLRSPLFPENQTVSRWQGRGKAKVSGIFQNRETVPPHRCGRKRYG
jgi:hypothetical protein